MPQLRTACIDSDHADTPMQGFKWQPGQRKQQFQSLSTIEPAAARGHSRQPSADGPTVANGAPVVQLSAFRRLSSASMEKRGVHKSQALADEHGELERQPLVGRDHADSAAQPPAADQQTVAGTSQESPQHQQQGAVLGGRSSMSPPELSSARQVCRVIPLSDATSCSSG